MIYVDTREPWEQAGEAISQAGGDWALESMGETSEHHGADYVLAERQLAVQRKTVNDFVGSVGDGLKATMHRIRAGHDYSALLLEGDWRVMGGSIAVRRGSSFRQVMPAAQFHNFIASQQLRGSILLRSSSLSETGRILASLDRYLTERDHTPPVTSPDDPTVVLELLPGIGSELASRIVDEHGTVLSALAAIGSWDEIDGIGSETKQQVVEYLNHE